MLSTTIVHVKTDSYNDSLVGGAYGARVGKHREFMCANNAHTQCSIRGSMMYFRDVCGHKHICPNDYQTKIGSQKTLKIDLLPQSLWRFSTKKGS